MNATLPLVRMEQRALKWSISTTVHVLLASLEITAKPVRHIVSCSNQDKEIIIDNLRNQ